MVCICYKLEPVQFCSHSYLFLSIVFILYPSGIPVAFMVPYQNLYDQELRNTCRFCDLWPIKVNVACLIYSTGVLPLVFSLIHRTLLKTKDLTCLAFDFFGAIPRTPYFVFVIPYRPGSGCYGTLVIHNRGAGGLPWKSILSNRNFIYKRFKYDVSMISYDFHMMGVLVLSYYSLLGFCRYCNGAFS